MRAGARGRGGEWREKREGKGGGGACVFVGGGREQLCLWDPRNPSVRRITDLPLCSLFSSVFICFPLPFSGAEQNLSSKSVWNSVCNCSFEPKKNGFRIQSSNYLCELNATIQMI